MALGAGKYDDLATYIREQSHAVGVIVIIQAGNKGSGFSVQSIDPDFDKTIPKMLEYVAQEIRNDVTKDN